MRRKNSTGRIYIMVVTLIVMLVMGISIYRLWVKNAEYKAREEALLEELKEQELEKERLAEKENYIGSRQYIEDEAKSKLGLVYDREIIFREK